ncbi:hypothetical protein FC84_GL001586 [Lapidilactobacillus dextrinicus DSM 20335]|uniref:Uncharacterized protein n=1 Tax=Lapidilactobacillus dextrinicus DSM 20335 TaxID=1423738 RepID=A0A0R2BLH2_9LACO|nr:hypothetical protein [Lapidilactobacillus dextrinicus]KRM79410.1 hypothetical protein FC84_GL001586 [Lapidilactobacillus dextrinicus DSM 20335]QFG46757.1 hypothetical protein LH506_04535 [Lapidilactobacillus dextrinicus]
MALTTIFTGMEKGPEQIDANFKELNSSKLDNRYSTKHYSTGQNSLIKAGSIDIARSENTVTVTCSFKLSKDLAANGAIMTLPAGYAAPGFQIRIAAMLSNNKQALIVVDRNALKTSVAITADDYITMTVTYPTNDDFPIE